MESKKTQTPALLSQPKLTMQPNAGLAIESLFAVSDDDIELSSNVEQSFDPDYQSVRYDGNVDTFNDNLSEACRHADKPDEIAPILRAEQITGEQLKRMVEVSAAENKPDLIKHIVNWSKSGARVRAVTEPGDQFVRAAFIAAQRGHLDSLKCLLSLGVVTFDAAKDSQTEDTLLHIAAAHNHVPVVEELYKRNSDLSTKLNAAGLAPLHVAVASGRQQVIEHLLENSMRSPVLFRSKTGNTALHSACQNNQEAIARFLITQCTADFLTSTNNKGFLPIHFAAAKGNLKMVKMISEYMEKRHFSSYNKEKSGWTPLHCAVEADHLEVVKYFCSQPHFTPDFCTKQVPLSPLHSAALNGKQAILDYLLRCHKFSPSILCKVFVFSNALHLAAYRGQASCCKILIEDYNLSPLEATGTGCTAAHFAARLESPATLQCIAKIKDSPLEATCTSCTVAYFSDRLESSATVQCTAKRKNTKEIQYSPAAVIGCSNNANKITPLHVAAFYGNVEVASWLLSTGKCDPNAPMRKSKTTPLHVAASQGHLECVKAISVCDTCNPNVKDASGKTPFLVAASEEIGWELIKEGSIPAVQTKWYDSKFKYGFLKSWSTILPSVRLFVVGASKAGKSTLVKALQREKQIIKSSVKEDEVEPHTTGIIPVKYESSTFGSVTIYDFSGDEEYYSSHEAFLEKVRHFLAIFVIVVNLQNDINELKCQVRYWRNFIKQATRSSSKELVIVLGSHCDLLKERLEQSSKKAALQEICENEKGVQWLEIDCRMPGSKSMRKLRGILREFCAEAKSKLPVCNRVHAFAAFLKDAFETSAVCQRKEIDSSIDAYGPPSTEFKEEAEELLQNLSNCGDIFYSPDKDTPSNGWIILNQELVFHGIHGYQERAKEYNLESIHGVISMDQLKKLFHIPGCNDPDMVAHYLVHMKFCHPIDSPEILSILTKKTGEMNCRYFLFPDLIETDPPEEMWQENTAITCYSGFVFQCRSAEDFITPRFVQVLLLRIAFGLAATTTNNKPVPAECSLWKNGIHWVKLGIETIIELTEGRRSLLVLCRSEERNKMDLVKHRAMVLEKVNEVVKECLSMPLNMLVVHPRNCRQHPINFSDQQVRFYKFDNVFKALSQANGPDQQHVSRTCLNMRASRIAASQCHVDELLYFEALSLVNGKQLAVMSQWEGNLDEPWLYENLATYNMSKWKKAARVLDLDEATIVQISNKQQTPTACFHDALTEWLKGFECLPTFSDLVGMLEKYSIFQEEDMKKQACNS